MGRRQTDAAPGQSRPERSGEAAAAAEKGAGSPRERPRERSRERPRERRCIVTGNVGPTAGLLRFVLGPSGEVVPDLAEKLPGRGLWVTAEAAILRKAAAKNAFAKAARKSAVVPPDLAETVGKLLKQRCLNALGLARRAGKLVQGFAKVEAKLKEGKAFALIEAYDASDEGRRKLRALAQRVKPQVPVVSGFTNEELSLALGRTNVVHAALTNEAMAARFMAEWRRYNGFAADEAGFAG